MILELRWFLINYFIKKMILAKTRYKTHNNDHLAIVEAFKIWYYYLKDCRYKFLFLSIIIIYVNL